MARKSQIMQLLQGENTLLNPIPHQDPGRFCQVFFPLRHIWLQSHTIRSVETGQIIIRLMTTKTTKN